MKSLKLLIVLVIVAILAVAGYDAFKISKAHTDIQSVANDAASKAADQIRASRDTAKGRAAANTDAKANGDVVTKFFYDPAKLNVTVTVSGNADTLVAHIFDKKITQDITATGTHST